MDDVIGLITANYQTPELTSLTKHRTCATLPYGGRYRLLDFPLSNMVSSGIRTVGIIMPYNSSILDHVEAGSAWGLDRKNGGLFLLPGSAYGFAGSEARFPLRDIRRNLIFLSRSPAPYVIVTASNTVCTMNYTDLIQKHLSTGADITMVYHTAQEDDKDLTGLEISEGRVRGVTRGVKRGEAAFLDCFLISRSQLLNLVKWYSAIDYLDIFQAMAEDYDKMDVRPYRFDGYARSIFNVQSYARRSMDLLQEAVRQEIFSADAPVVTKVVDGAPAKYMARAKVRNSLIPAGCVIDGTVENSILFRGVQVHRGACIRNSIVMQSCVVEEDACVENAVIDRDNIISAGSIMKGTPENMLVMGKGRSHLPQFMRED